MTNNTRSLKLSMDGKRQVDRALTDKVWGNDDLIDAVGVQVATVKNFRSGKAVEKRISSSFVRRWGWIGCKLQNSEAPQPPILAESS